MKYSESLVWKAVYEFVPSFKVANENRKVVNLPTALNTAGIIIFLELGNNAIASLGMDRGYAAFVIQDALKELQIGYMTFGDVEEYWA